MSFIYHKLPLEYPFWLFFILILHYEASFTSINSPKKALSDFIDTPPNFFFEDLNDIENGFSEEEWSKILDDLDNSPLANPNEILATPYPYEEPKVNYLPDNIILEKDIPSILSTLSLLPPLSLKKRNSKDFGSLCQNPRDKKTSAKINEKKRKAKDSSSEDDPAYKPPKKVSKELFIDQLSHFRRKTDLARKKRKANNLKAYSTLSVPVFCAELLTFILDFSKIKEFSSDSVAIQNSDLEAFRPGMYSFIEDSQEALSFLPLSVELLRKSMKKISYIKSSVNLISETKAIIAQRIKKAIKAEKDKKHSKSDPSLYQGDTQVIKSDEEKDETQDDAGSRPKSNLTTYQEERGSHPINFDEIFDILTKRETLFHIRSRPEISGLRNNHHN